MVDADAIDAVVLADAVDAAVDADAVDAVVDADAELAVDAILYGANNRDRVSAKSPTC